MLTYKNIDIPIQDGIIIYNSIAEDFQMFSKEASNWISLGKEELKFIINKKKNRTKNPTK